MCTLNGLCRYDNKSESFQTFKPKDGDINSISTDVVNCIAEDSQGNLWIGTNTGLNRIETGNGTTKFTRFLQAEPDEPAYVIQDISPDKKGGLWLATSKGLVWFENGNSQLFTANPDPRFPSLNDFTSIFNDGSGNIWLGIRTGGLFRFDISSRSFGFMNSFRSLDGGWPVISGFAPDKQGKLWVATMAGLASFDLKTLQPQWYVNNPVNDQSLGDNALFSIFKDREGGLWLGNYGVGIDYLNTSSPVFSRWPFFVDRALKNEFNNAWMGMTPDQKLWLIAQDKKQILFFDRSAGKTGRYDLDLSFAQNRTHFYVDEHKVIWCGGNHLLWSYDFKKGTRKSYPFPNPRETPPGRSGIYKIFQDRSQRLWVSGAFGLFYLDKKNATVRDTEIYDGIWSICEDSKGNIWAGGKNQVWRLPNGTGKPERIILNKKESSEIAGRTDVMRIIEDQANRIWLVTAQGLRLYDPHKQEFALFLKDNHRPLESFYDIQTDRNGYLWLSNGRYLVRYHPDKGTLQSYFYADGLPKKATIAANTAVKDSTGMLFYNTSQEMFSLDPDQVFTSDHEAPIVISSLRLFNKDVRANDTTRILHQEVHNEQKLVFRHDQNIFSLDFALLNYTRSHENRYRYRLEGFEQQWNEVQVPTATYMNLSPGEYTFVVHAANGDGFWNTSPLRVHIVVLPPWWKTWYAYLFYFLFVAGAVYGITRLFWLRSAFKKENELYQSKIDFFTNISHEIRTHLTLISGPLEKAFQSSSNGSDTRSFLTYTKNNTDKLLHLVNELLDFRKMQSGKARLQVAQHDVARVMKNVLASFEHIVDEKEISVDLVTPENPVLLWFDLSQLQKVFYNLLGNAFKFTPENGRVSIVINEGFNEVTITITDNGPGIAPKYLSRIFTSFFQVEDNGSTIKNKGYGIGLALSRSIVDRHHGDLSVTSTQNSEAGNGETSFTIRLMTGNWYLDDSDIVVAASSADNAEIAVLANDDSLPEQDAASDGESTLLIIEDNDELRSFAVELFRDNYRVIEAADGRSGLSIAQMHIPDVIVCDVMMPEMNGLEVCRKLRSDFNTRHIPVILISARNATTQMLEGLESGADDYLIKPFDFNILDAKIRTQLRIREETRLQYSRIISLEPGSLEIKDPDGGFIETLRNLVVQNLSDTGFGVEQMAFQMGMSVSVLYRKLRALTGMTVNSFTKNIRMKRARQLLESGHYNVNEVANQVGYDDSKYFSKEYKKTFAEVPSETKKTGAE